MATLSAYRLVASGAPATFVTPTASDVAPIGAANFAIYRNTTGSSVTVSLPAPSALANAYGELPGTHTMTLPAASGGIPGEIWIQLHRQYDNGSGQVVINTSSQTGIKVAVVQVI